MPMRTHDQRILGFYDTTPRKQMLADQFGDPETASGVHEELNDLPLPFEPEDLDIPDQASHEQPFFHPEANHFMDSSSIPAFPNTATAASGGTSSHSVTTTASGGTSLHSVTTTASGGTSLHTATTTASGGGRQASGNKTR